MRESSVQVSSFQVSSSANDEAPDVKQQHMEALAMKDVHIKALEEENKALKKENEKLKAAMQSLGKALVDMSN